MAYIVLNSKFNPFSYEELVKPLRDATTMHQATEEQFSDLSMEASKMEALMNSQSDTKSFQIYKKYTDDLKNEAERLQKEGLTPGSRQNLLSMRNRYNSEIGKVKTAREEYENMIKQRQSLAGKNVLFNNNYSSMDDFLEGAKADNSFVNLDDILAITSAQAKTIGQAKLGDLNSEKILGGQKFKITQNRGYTDTDITRAILGDSNADSALTNIVSDAREKANYNMRSEQEKAMIDNNILIGLRSSIFAPETNVLSNDNFISALQNDQITQQKINSGIEPYKIDKQGNKYFHNDVAIWTTDKDGNEKDFKYTKNMYRSDGSPMYVAPSKRDLEEQQEEEDRINSGLILTFNDSMTSQENSKFDLNSASVINIGALTLQQVKNLKSTLNEYNFTTSQAEIYKDRKGKLRIVPKGFAADGVTKLDAPTPNLPGKTLTSTTVGNNQNTVPINNSDNFDFYNVLPNVTDTANIHENN